LRLGRLPRRELLRALRLGLLGMFDAYGARTVPARARLGDQRAHRRGGIRALARPVVDSVEVEHQTRRVRKGLVVAEGRDEAAVARRRAVGHDDPVVGLLLPAHAPESNTYGHLVERSWRGNLDPPREELAQTPMSVAGGDGYDIRRAGA